MPTDDPAAQRRWREAAHALTANSEKLLAPLEPDLLRVGLDFDGEVAGVSLAALLGWATSCREDADWWAAQLAEQGRLVAEKAYGLDASEYEAQNSEGVERLAAWLRIEPEWRDGS